MIHDAARAMVTSELISASVHALAGYDGAMPVLPIKDAVFLSYTGSVVDQLVDRNKLYMAQTPECFYLLPYWEINNRTSPEDRAKVLGNYELAYAFDWKIHPFLGDENNFKLTTPSDVDRMIALLEKRN